MNPQDYCRQVCRDSHSNFVKTFYFMPRYRRQGFEAFYAFCRLVDDAVDEADSMEVAEQELARWSQEVETLYTGTPQSPVAQALAPVIERFDIPREYLEDLIAGCTMDLHKSSYASFEELKTYCYRVASCVGLVSLHLFEAKLTEQTRYAAIHLGMAVQLTNILRDIMPDLQLNRIYLPLDDLDKYRVRSDDFRQVQRAQGNLLTLLQFEIDRARHFFNEAWNNFPTDLKENRQLIAAHMMGKIYETLLDKIAKDPLRIFREKVRISGWKKLSITGRLAANFYWPS